MAGVSPFESGSSTGSSEVKSIQPRVVKRFQHNRDVDAVLEPLVAFLFGDLAVQAGVAMAARRRQIFVAPVFMVRMEELDHPGAGGRENHVGQRRPMWSNDVPR